MAIGMMLDAHYPGLEGRLAEQHVRRIEAVLATLGLPLWHDALDLREEGDEGDESTRLVLHGLEGFREHLGGRLTITLLDAIGRGVEVHTINDPRMDRAVGRLRESRIAP